MVGAVTLALLPQPVLREFQRNTQYPSTNRGKSEKQKITERGLKLWFSPQVWVRRMLRWWCQMLG